jgi:hypothetical protein
VIFSIELTSRRYPSWSATALVAAGMEKVHSLRLNRCYGSNSAEASHQHRVRFTSRSRLSPAKLLGPGCAICRKPRSRIEACLVRNHRRRPSCLSTPCRITCNRRSFGGGGRPLTRRHDERGEITATRTLGVVIVAACSFGIMGASPTALKPFDPIGFQSVVEATAKELLLPGAMVLLRTPQGAIPFEKFCNHNGFLRERFVTMPSGCGGVAWPNFHCIPRCAGDRLRWMVRN